MSTHYFSGTGERCIFYDEDRACGRAKDDAIHSPGSVLSPGFGHNAEFACALALAEVGFGEHALSIAPLLRDALSHRGFEWTGGTAREG